MQGFYRKISLQSFTKIHEIPSYYGDKIRANTNDIPIVSKVAFIILSPSAIEASHSWLMRQFELYAIITQPIALMSVAACQASGRLCLFT